MSTELVHLPSLAPSKRTTGEKDRKGQQSEDVLGPLWSKPLSAKPEGRLRVPPIRHLPREWRVAPRPGDVHRPSPRDWNKPRPLGLLPERERDFDPFFFFYEPLPPVDVGPSHSLGPLLKQKQWEDNDDRASVLSRSNWSASRPQSRAVAEGGEQSPPSFEGTAPVPYRASTEWRHTPSQEAAPPPEEWKEREYFEALVRIAEMDILARSRGQEVAPRPGGSKGAGKENLRQPRGRGIHWEDEPDIRPPLNTPDVTMVKQTPKGSRGRSLSGPTSYFSFVNQAAMSTRVYDLDQRWAKDYEPCARCRLRGGRCSQCKAIRTGGGYIILNLGEEDGRLKKGDDGDVCECDGDGVRQNTPVEGERAGTSLGVIREGDEGGSGGRKQDGDDWDNGRRGLSGRGRGQGGGAGDNGGGLGDGSDSGRRSRTGGESGRRSAGGSRVRSGRLGSGRGSRLSSARSGRGTDDSDDESGRKRSGLNLSSDSDNLNSTRDGLSGRGNEGDGGGGGRTRDGSGKGGRQRESVDRLPRGSRDGNLTKSSRKAKRTSGEGESDGEDDDKSRKVKGQRGRRKKGSGEEGDGSDSEGHDDGQGKERRQLRVGGLKKEEEEEEPKSKVPGDLRRFRSKKNDMKAVSCTLKDLKDIDPLDYLAKYCILDPKKIPNYRRVYENVDRDEDDEINIQELDFALKAVNFELISDPELSYIHSVLELAGRWRLNFRLFSLIAALSEKVVALEDMVKKLINTMDVQALEVKMKKCKELFYLLDSMDSTGRGGVVTTQSLAVELQAGGLTQEHVEYVVDHLNHEGRGIVEFLDYLTYVPLFVEIHDSICGNPLDVSRTK